MVISRRGEGTRAKLMTPATRANRSVTCRVYRRRTPGKVGLLSPRWMDNNPSVTQIAERRVGSPPPHNQQIGRLDLLGRERLACVFGSSRQMSPGKPIY
ncbi:hypothetical protein CEXT_245371 [Caerostris extrusa]|uniref:Uncharacterized protein n=1 Tax=Caerostris extrusa TaxID=172846 RepID=A0AAV4YCE8_CAEEX|nr:hypothetical protein CEXT_245371 [Caerostris extrusa]